ncbi:HPr kinase/phosphorylase [Sedimentitalea todarodis]|uniref:HPr kinase/phosphatase C-terminal domain-containing protein n=1 Tax=Sedimentitalea todarodis TaxID=1631240 RepID=A0ABU3V9E0_9RHOB|nr:HPr kinase/phosphatase C-terminal domain-containing protein [Sedimentitalea todarodis]MDU9002780.1 HPr kinase/phosphatase C-terminal domain-containing protein [Sedimentitalea todarodis]
MAIDQSQHGTEPTIVHASCVAVAKRGCLIIGASASGKSSLALSLMGYGASLIADDRVVLERSATGIRASAPPAIRGLIEARGVGILTCEPANAVVIGVVVDMDTVETARLPQARTTELLGEPVTLLHRVCGPHFAPALMQFLKSGRKSP